MKDCLEVSKKHYIPRICQNFYDLQFKFVVIAVSFDALILFNCHKWEVPCDCLQKDLDKKHMCYRISPYLNTCMCKSTWDLY